MGSRTTFEHDRHGSRGTQDDAEGFAVGLVKLEQDLARQADRAPQSTGGVDTSLASLTNMLEPGDGLACGDDAMGAGGGGGGLSEDEIRAFRSKYATATASRDVDERRSALRQKLQQDWAARCAS